MAKVMQRYKPPSRIPRGRPKIKKTQQPASPAGCIFVLVVFVDWLNRL